MVKPHRDGEAADSLVDHIWKKQLAGWKNGKLTPAEQWLAEYPQLTDHCELAVDVIFNEFVILAGDKSKSADPVHFCQRFPQYQTELHRQFSLFQAIGSDWETEPIAQCADKLIQNRFELRDQVGMGSTATIYLAWDHKLQNKVAIKRPHLQATRRPRVLKRMVQEAQSVSRLHHPGIIPIREIVHENGSFFLVSPFVNGVNLQDVVEQKLPPLTDAVDWIIQIADALHYAHENGIVHRDVNPSNVILNESGRPMLTDFGLATDSESEQSIAHFENAQQLDRGPRHHGLADYWRFEFASIGVGDFGSPETIHEDAEFSALDEGQQRYLEGLTASNSLQALTSFKEALNIAPNHHSARKMSLIMALSLARFEEVLYDVEISRQLFPEDIDFQLIQALALSMTDRLPQALGVIEQIDLPKQELDNWTQLCRELPLAVPDANDENDAMTALSHIAKFVAATVLEYKPLLQNRHWRFPPRIAEHFVGLPELVLTPQRPHDELDWLRNLADIHPEGTLVSMAAANSLEQVGLDNTTEQLETTRDLFRKAIELPAFVEATHELSAKGLFATSVALALVHGKDVEANTKHYVYAASQINPLSIDSSPQLRAFAISLIKAEQWELATGFVDAWNSRKQPFALQADAAWHRAILLKHAEDWDKLYALCSEFLQNNNDKLGTTELPSWQGWQNLRHLARTNLEQLLKN